MTSFHSLIHPLIHKDRSSLQARGYARNYRQRWSRKCWSLPLRRSQSDLSSTRWRKQIALQQLCWSKQQDRWQEITGWNLLRVGSQDRHVWWEAVTPKPHPRKGRRGWPSARGRIFRQSTVPVTRLFLDLQAIHGPGISWERGGPF